MALPTIFQRRRSVKASTSSSFLRYPVKTEQEFIAALGNIAARFEFVDGVLPGSLGGEIVIERSFTAKQTPYVLDYKHSGIVIRALGGCPILPDTANQGSLFSMRTFMGTICDLAVFYRGDSAGTPTKWFNTFVTAEANGVTEASRNRIADCTVFVGRLYVDSSAGVGDAVQITGCRIPSSPEVTHAACVTFDSARCVLGDCDLHDGGGDSVTIENDGEDCRIRTTDFGGGDATSTASTNGNNTWTGNVRVPTLTLHANDEEAANTP